MEFVSQIMENKSSDETFGQRLFKWCSEAWDEFLAFVGSTRLIVADQIIGNRLAIKYGISRNWTNRVIKYFNLCWSNYFFF